MHYGGMRGGFNESAGITERKEVLPETMTSMCASRTSGSILMSGSLILACLLIYAAVPHPVEASGEVSQKLKLAEEFQLRYLDQQAVNLFEEVLMIHPDNRQALWKAAYLHVRLGWIEKNVTTRRLHYQKAYAHAERVFRQHPDSYEANLVLGAAKAKLAEFQTTGEKIRTARELEDHARFLLNQRTDHPDVWYLLGWWHFKLAQVSAAERFLASLFYGGLPGGASIEQAFACLQKAVALRPDYVAYRHDLGLFYERTGNPSKACEIYRAAIHRTPRAPEDFVFIEKARMRLAKIES
jgi:tetratricopeptide (TPR) repeat protein